MERYVDEGAKNYSPFAARTEVAPQYRPRSDEPSFDLVTVNAPTDRVSIFQADPSKSLLEYYVRQHDVLFAVHPETWAAAGIEHLDELRALPRDQPTIPAASRASSAAGPNEVELDEMMRRTARLSSRGRSRRRFLDKNISELHA